MTDLSAVDLTQKKALTLDEVASLMSISRRTVQDLITRGDLVSVRIGSRRLVRPAAIDAYLDSLDDGAPLSPRRMRRIG